MTKRKIDARREGPAAAPPDGAGIHLVRADPRSVDEAEAAGFGAAAPGSDARENEGPARRAKRGPSAARGEIRERIRAAARTEFIAVGYDGATIRAIARRAGCDSALVNYYFESKQKLFRAAMDLPLDPAAEVIRILADGPDGLVRRMLDYAVDIYEQRLTADTMFALMRALMTDAATLRRFRTYIRTDIIDRVGDYLGADERFGEQVAITLSTMYGIATMRYIVKLEPIASLPREEFIDLVEPLLTDRITALAQSLPSTANEPGQSRLPPD